MVEHAKFGGNRKRFTLITLDVEQRTISGGAGKEIGILWFSVPWTLGTEVALICEFVRFPSPSAAPCSE